MAVFLTGALIFLLQGRLWKFWDYYGLEFICITFSCAFWIAYCFSSFVSRFCQWKGFLGSHMKWFLKEEAFMWMEKVRNSTVFLVLQQIHLWKISIFYVPKQILHLQPVAVISFRNAFLPHNLPNPSYPSIQNSKNEFHDFTDWMLDCVLRSSCINIDSWWMVYSWLWFKYMNSFCVFFLRSMIHIHRNTISVLFTSPTVKMACLII